MNTAASDTNDFRRILVATDFSPASRSALSQALQLADKTGAKVTLAHTLPNLRKLVESASYEGRVDFLYGEGSEFYREVREDSDRKMRQIVADVNAQDRNIEILTLLGTPYLEITHAVQRDKCDLVVTGTRGLSSWQNFLVGSTANRLIQKCPASVWIVKGTHKSLPKSILAATDFSEASRKSVLEALSIAKAAGAELHLVSVIDSYEASTGILSRMPDGDSVQQALMAAATSQFDKFVESLKLTPDQYQRHLCLGVPAEEIVRLAAELKVELVAMSTVGRSGIKGVLLGNTAERVLASCDCSILTTKSADFVSPIMAPIWPLTHDQRT